MPIIGAVVFTAGWFVAGRVEPGYNPRRDYISSLSAADAHNPWIMIVAFVVFGVGVVALGIRLVGALRDHAGRAAAAFVIMSGVGIVVCGLARHDCSVQFDACMEKVSAGVVSTEHLVHDAASGAVFMLGGLAQLLIAVSARRHSGWENVWPAALASGALTLVLFGVMNLDVLSRWTGVFERTLVVSAAVCVCLLGRHLYRLARRDAVVAEAGMPPHETTHAVDAEESDELAA